MSPLSSLLLALLTLHTSASSFILHLCKRNPDSHFTPSNAILVSEMFKLLLSLWLAFHSVAKAPRKQQQLTISATGRKEEDVDTQYRLAWLANGGKSQDVGELKKTMRTMNDRLFHKKAWLLAVPAALYVLQNNLRIFAASRLDPPTFQVLSELKLVSTAVASTVILKKRLDRVQWLSIFLLLLGVVVVQGQGQSYTASTGGSEERTAASILSHDGALLGFLALVAACTISGVAGVYLEKLVERGDLWTMNAQLSFFSLLPALMPLLIDSLNSATLINPFDGFDCIVWLTVASQTSGGLIVSLVIKYCGNIQKNFSQGAAIVLSYCACLFFLHTNVSLGDLLGCAMVILATFLFNSKPSSRDRTGDVEEEDNEKLLPAYSSPPYSPPACSSPPFSPLYEQGVLPFSQDIPSALSPSWMKSQEGKLPFILISSP